MYNEVLLRYGEIALKGSNRHQFENRLIHNIRAALSDLPPHRIYRTYSRMFIVLQNDWEEVSARLQRVFGLVSFSPVCTAELDLKAIREAALLVYKDACASDASDGSSQQSRGSKPSLPSFKVSTRRSNKRFLYDSMELNNLVGGYIIKSTQAPVDLHDPDHTVYLEIRDEAAYIFSTSVAGLGGLPIGCNGHGLLMLSGGIDSPVAAWLSMKRGLTVTGLHFYSFPFTSERSKQKVLDLCQTLTAYCGRMRLIIAPFTAIQTAIHQQCPQELYVTLMRRMMFRIAEQAAVQENAEAILTGENLGQVASQTLASINVISRVVSMPVLRPLITYDKLEIIDLAKKIDTYEISIRPYEDCCTVFVPKHPAIHPKLNKTIEAEQVLDKDALLAECMANLEIIEFAYNREPRVIRSSSADAAAASDTVELN